MALEPKDLYIVDEFREVVERVKTALELPVLNYQFGEDEHIIKAMRDMKKEKVTSYPLIAVVLPVDIQRGNSGGYYGKALIPRVVIATVTNQLSSPETRMEQVIKPIIQPVYNRLLLEIKNQVKTFVIMGDIKHTERTRFGTQTAAQGFTEYLDGKELLNMEITLKQDFS
jgi:hypothetical protein